MRLFQRNGVWHVEYSRNRRKSLKTNDEKKARKLFEAIEREYLTGRIIKLDPGQRMTLGQFRDSYLEHREPLVSPSTYRQDKISLQSLIDVLGADILLRSVNVKKLDEYKAFMLVKQYRGKPVRPESINSYLRHIRAALNTAVEWEWIPKAPKVKGATVHEHEPRVLGPDEIKSLIKKADPEFRRMVIFYLWTGCRRTEALNLQWQNITWGDKPTALLTKTKGRRDRRVPLLPAVAKALKPIKKDIGPVFPQIHPDTVSHRFGELAALCGIKARLHDLRHTSATWMIASGVNPRVVQEILGHASFSTTEKYAHVIQNRLHDEAGKLKFK